MNRLTDIQEILNYSELVYKHPQNISRKFEKDSSSRTGVITDNLYLVRQWDNEQLTDIHEIWNYLKLVYKHPKNVFRKFEKDSSSWTGYINDNLFSVRKWGNEQTDTHTSYLKLFKISVQTSQESFQKIWDIQY